MKLLYYNLRANLALVLLATTCLVSTAADIHRLVISRIE